MSAIILTDAQRRQVMDDMDGRVEMLSDKEVEHLATKLNQAVNVPILKEGTEQTLLVKMVKLVDRYLYNSLPNEYYRLVKEATDGIDEDEAEKLVVILTERVNKEVNIKYVPEDIERAIFKFLIDAIVRAMAKHIDIFTATA
jgi:hypothetical protein